MAYEGSSADTGKGCMNGHWVFVSCEAGPAMTLLETLQCTPLQSTEL